MDKLRISFTQTGRAQWISHLDMMRMLQRAMNRSGVPIKYSEGFNPHPRLNIALPLSIYQEGERELCDFRLTEEVDASVIKEKLHSAAFPGLDIVSVEIADAFNNVVVAVKIGTRKIVPADDRRIRRTRHQDGHRTRWMGIKPAVGSSARIVYPAPLDHAPGNLRADFDGSIIHNAPFFIHPVNLEKPPAFIKSRNPHPPPTRDVAVAKADELRILNFNRVIRPTTQNAQGVENNIPRHSDDNRRFAALAKVERAAVLGDNANPSILSSSFGYDDRQL